MNSAPSRAPSTRRPAPPAETGPTITIQDVLYMLFRNKWKIIICSAIGISVGLYNFHFRKTFFHSDAKLFIRYVLADNQGPLGGSGEDASRKSPDQAGETIMDTEIQILTSLDLAKHVVDGIGAEKIVQKDPRGDIQMDAAVAVLKGLTVQVAPRTSVIRISFSHDNPEIVQSVLREIVDQYLKRHVEIHRAAGMVGDFLTQQTDELRVRLSQTEDELRKARAKAGVISVEESKKTDSAQMAALRQQIFAAQAELAERTTALKEFTSRSTSSQPATVAPSSEEPPKAEPEPAMPTPEQIDEYRSLLTRSAMLRRTEQELLTQYTSENDRVKEVREQLVTIEQAKRKLEQEAPRLIRTAPPPPSASSSAQLSASTGSPVQTFDANAESVRIGGLQAKIKVLETQRTFLQNEATKLDEVEGAISELLRNKDLQEANYRNYSANLEQFRIRESLSSGKVSNIEQIQTPTPPAVDANKARKTLAAFCGAGIALGFIWAVLRELFLDRSVRRPVDIERMMVLPLMLSIPKQPSPKKLKLPKGEKPLALASPVTTRAMDIFHDTLSDRLIRYFENANLTHKPKLVAVTGIGSGAGVTTVASGLASALSETGGGNVLLVDLTPRQGSAQHFYRGNPVRGLDDLFSTRESAKVQQNLFVVAEDGADEALCRALPHRFSKLVPELKSSNFDYIIFDLPAVSQISVTPRLAAFMDMVLLVLESEKTDRDVVKRATELLTESKTHVGIVLNKTRNYVPTWIGNDHLLAS